MNKTKGSRIETSYKLSELLKEQKILFPAYQRNYSWHKSYFFKNFIEVFDHYDMENPIFPSVLHMGIGEIPGKKFFYCIDGRQRITTYVILGISIYIYLKLKFMQDNTLFDKINENDEEISRLEDLIRFLSLNKTMRISTLEKLFNAEIYNIFSVLKDLDEKNEKENIDLINEFKTFFNSVNNIDTLNKKFKKYKKNKYINSCYNFIYLLKNIEEKHKLNKIFNIIHNYLQIKFPYFIYENINETNYYGLYIFKKINRNTEELNILELLKSTLMITNIPENKYLIKDVFELLENKKLDENKIKSSLVSFLWNMNKANEIKNFKVNNDVIIDEIESLIEEKDITTILKSLKYYLTILRNVENLDGKEYVIIKDFIFPYKLSKNSVYKYILVSLLFHNYNEEIIKNFITNVLNPYLYGNAISLGAVNQADVEIFRTNELRQIIKIISGTKNNEIEFIKEFKNFLFSNNKYFYYKNNLDISKIYTNSAADSIKILKYLFSILFNLKAEDIQIEHFIPISWINNYDKFKNLHRLTEEELEEIIYSIGNIFSIPQKINLKLSNNMPKEKIKIIEANNISLTPCFESFKFKDYIKENDIKSAIEMRNKILVNKLKNNELFEKYLKLIEEKKLMKKNNNDKKKKLEDFNTRNYLITTEQIINYLIEKLKENNKILIDEKFKLNLVKDFYPELGEEEKKEIKRNLNKNMSYNAVYNKLFEYFVDNGYFIDVEYNSREPKNKLENSKINYILNENLKHGNRIITIKKDS